MTFSMTLRDKSELGNSKSLCKRHLIHALERTRYFDSRDESEIIKKLHYRIFIRIMLHTEVLGMTKHIKRMHSKFIYDFDYFLEYALVILYTKILYPWVCILKDYLLYYLKQNR